MIVVATSGGGTNRHFIHVGLLTETEVSLLSSCNTYSTIIPQKFHKVCQTMLGEPFSIGDTTPRFTTSIEQDKLELVTLNIIFSSVTVGLSG